LNGLLPGTLLAAVLQAPPLPYARTPTGIGCLTRRSVYAELPR
jgi:hypothetical protein